MPSTWDVIKKLREMFGWPPKDDGSQQISLLVDLAPLGTSERVSQLKRLVREFQRMCEDAAEAYRDHLRPGSFPPIRKDRR